MKSALYVSLLSALVGSMTGLHFSKRYKQKSVYFAQLIDFVTLLKTEISFRRESIEKIVKEYKSSSTLFCEQLKQLADYYDGKPLELKRGFLSTEEYAQVSNFLSFLGSTDAVTQISGIQASCDIFSAYENKHTAKFNKYGSALIKLGLLGGLGFGILII